MLKEIYVYTYLHPQGWVPVGLLQYEEEGRFSSSSFRYGKKYLENSDSFAIDPVQLPLKDGTFTTDEGFSLFNGIRDAGPDKWGRYLLEKKFHRGLTELEFIAACGTDRVGALAFSDDPASGPKVYTPNGFEFRESKYLDLELCVGALKDVEASQESARLDEYLRYGPSLGGARPKALVRWQGKTYLAKFSLSSDQRSEPLIEYAAMTLAVKCGLTVPSIEKTEVAGRSVYLIERFDRRKNGTPIPFISGLTLTGIHESDYSSWSYHALVEALLKYSSHPERDLRELFERMVFNILVYNNDDHLRNFGFLSLERDRWDLSPLYDVVPTTVRSQSYSMAMTVGLEGKKASVSNALSKCEGFRLSRDEASSLVAKMEEVVADWRDHFRKCGLSESDIQMLENSFSPKP